MQKELEYLGGALANPKRPFVAVLGGAKISGKIDVIEALLPKVDRLLIGGAMACTFFRAMGLETGTSLVEEDRVAMARELLARAGDKLMLPSDAVVSASLKEPVGVRVVDCTAITSGQAMFDIGPDTRARFGDVIAGAATVVWNGPMGVFETKTSSMPGRPPWQPRCHWPPRGAPRRLWAVEIRPRRSSRLAWKAACRTSPREAGLHWNSWKGRCSRGLPRWMIVPRDTDAGFRRQLENESRSLRCTGFLRRGVRGAVSRPR